MPTTQFDQFFPQWNRRIQEILATKCAQELAVYKTGHRAPSAALSALVGPVVDCILKEFPEGRKVELAASAVLLGLTPTILQTLGSTTGEMALLSLRRPFLAFLLGVGSPTVSPMRAFTYDDPIALLAQPMAASPSSPPPRSSSFAPTAVAPALWHRRGSSWQARLVSAVEYAVVAACVANVVQLSYELTIHGVVIFSPEGIFQVPLWISLAVFLHVAGAALLRMRVHVRKLDDPRARQHEEPEPERRWARRFHPPTWLRDELTPSAHHGPTRLEYRAESMLLIALMWVASIATVVHMLWGTLTLSSLLFFSVADSALIVGRYGLSVLACRVVLMYELAGMKAASRRAMVMTPTRVHASDGAYYSPVLQRGGGKDGVGDEDKTAGTTAASSGHDIAHV